MSRERLYEYTVTLTDEQVRAVHPGGAWDPPFDALDALALAIEDCAAPANFGFGHVTNIEDTATATYVMSANRAKARRIAARPDMHLAAMGDLRESVD